MCIKHGAGKVSFFCLSDLHGVSINLSVASSGLFIVFPIECWIARHCAGLLSSQGETLSGLHLRISYLSLAEQKVLSFRLDDDDNKKNCPRSWKSNHLYCMCTCKGEGVVDDFSERCAAQRRQESVEANNLNKCYLKALGDSVCKLGAVQNRGLVVFPSVEVSTGFTCICKTINFTYSLMSSSGLDVDNRWTCYQCGSWRVLQNNLQIFHNRKEKPGRLCNLPFSGPH